MLLKSTFTLQTCHISSLQKGDCHVSTYPSQSKCTTKSTSSLRRRRLSTEREGRGPPPVARSNSPWLHTGRRPLPPCSPPATQAPVCGSLLSLRIQYKCISRQKYSHKKSQPEKVLLLFTKDLPINCPICVYADDTVVSTCHRLFLKSQSHVQFNVSLV